MAEDKQFSVTKLMAGLGGALLVAAFFLPMVDTSQPMARDMFGIRDMRRQIESTRETEAIRPMIEPALQTLEHFAATPSLLNFVGVVSVTREILDTAASLGVAEAGEMRTASKLLGYVRMALWLLPIVGLIQLAGPALTRLHGNAGAPGLIARFVFGLLFLVVALIPILGAPDAQRGLFGPAVWTLLVGAILMVVAGLFGVTRRNWWIVLLADIAFVVVSVLAIKSLVENIERM